ncbi:nucleotidyl transferase AbiEii/AbiGii toxin family protein [Candidatus Roizmanbacteria bacterium]|nr:nucleotidyl transferase AbiEii/AbiGii toxin family protein [Candidatus Roizmanbacteria bacterium]
MISQSAIQRIAQKLQSTELNIRREYIQHLFLSYFYQQPDSDKVYFKGGTALRIIYQSPRFSEDLDFSSTTAALGQMEDILIQTAREIEQEGIKVDIKEAKKTSGGYLAIIHFVLGDHEVAIQLEISRRSGIDKGEAVTVVNDFMPPYTLITLFQDQLIAEKIQALLTRQKARDFYDLYFIVRARLLPPKKKDVLKKVLVVLSKTHLPFEQELKIFLPKSHWAIMRNFKNTLEQEIRRAI